MKVPDYSFALITNLARPHNMIPRQPQIAKVPGRKFLIHLIYLTAVGGGDSEGGDAQAHARRNPARGELNRWTAGVN